MKLHRLLIAASAAIAIGFGLALSYAQNAGQLIVSPLGTEYVQIIGTGATNSFVTLTQLRDGAGYLQASPLTGFSLTAPVNGSMVSFTPAGTIATGTLTMPVGATDGQRMQVFTTQTITAFTLSPGAGQSINGTAITTMAANTAFEYFYKLSNTTWYRVQ